MTVQAFVGKTFKVGFIVISSTFFVNLFAIEAHANQTNQSIGNTSNCNTQLNGDSNTISNTCVYNIYNTTYIVNGDSREPKTLPSKDLGSQSTPVIHQGVLAIEQPRPRSRSILEGQTSLSIEPLRPRTTSILRK